MRIERVACVCICAGLQSAAAQPAIQLEPEIVLCAVRDAYRGRQVIERVTIDVRARGMDSSDSLTMWVDGTGERVTLELGAVIVEVTPGALTAVHSLNAVDVLVVENTWGSVGEMLRVSLPPLVLPQIDWALGGDCFPDLKPFADPMEWKQVVVPPTNSGMLVIEGRSSAREIRIAIDEGTSQLRTVSLEDPKSGVKIEVSVKPLGLKDIPVPQISAEGRVRVDRFQDLAAKPGDIGVGMRLPDMLLSSAPLDEQDLGRSRPASTYQRAADLISPGAIALFRGKAQAVRSAAEALRAIQSAGTGRSEFGAYFAAVTEPGTPADKEEMAKLSALVAPSPLNVSNRAAETIDRFAPEWFGVVVVYDELWRVKELIRLPSDEELGPDGTAQGERLRELDDLKKRISGALRK